MLNDKLIEWKKNGGHLPNFLRNQEDQEHLMRLMSYYYSDADKNNPLHTHSLAILKKYLFNVFFDYFADAGITLQPIKHKSIEFLDLKKELNAYKEFECGHLKEISLQTTTSVKMFEIDDYRNQLLFLPEFMNTFDKFKHLFRNLHRSEDKAKQYGTSFYEIDYMTGTIFIIDFVLWFFAEYGYKLKKSKKKLEFKDLIYEA